MQFEILRVEKPFPYTGKELRPHFNYSQFSVKGSSLISFEGECKVATEDLVDWEDRINHDFIASKKMVHFLGEFFATDLRAGIFAQRLLMTICADQIRILSPLPRPIVREGDDLYLAMGGSERKKLSVSIVTASPVSVLLHAGINIDPEGAPVPAAGLAGLQVDSARFADEVLFAFQREWEDVEWAMTKVKPV